MPTRFAFDVPGTRILPVVRRVITAEPGMLRSLLQGLASLQVSPSVSGLVVLVLNNGSPAGELDVVVEAARATGLAVAVIDEARQRQDAKLGAFGAGFRARSAGRVGIAQGRTMLQRYLGEVLESEPGSVGWLLDDDMRVDERALSYLRWLPAFRDEGVDVLIGASEGVSPNPPLNGLRVQLVDLFHNLLWLRSLGPQAVLPDRSAENAVMRSESPDYYYDLSRKHTAHLEMPHRLEPTSSGETVEHAYARLVSGAAGILRGEVITRPVVVSMPANPLADAKHSVNRGGCTFILNPRAVTQTPNVAPRLQGREARRSDMMWAIVNRHYRHLTIQAVGFPVRHLARAAGSPRLDVEKVQAEIVGSAVYAGLTEFLKRSPDHELDFTAEQLVEIRLQSAQHLERRLLLLEQSFYRIAGLRESIRRLAEPGELEELLSHLDHWFTREQFTRIRDGAVAQSAADLERFLSSLRGVADDFAAAVVCTDFIHAQLASSAVRGPAGNKTEALQPSRSEGHSAAF